MNIDVRIDGNYMSLACDRPVPPEMIACITREMTETIMEVMRRHEADRRAELQDKPF